MKLQKLVIRSHQAGCLPVSPTAFVYIIKSMTVFPILRQWAYFWNSFSQSGWYFFYILPVWKDKVVNKSGVLGVLIDKGFLVFIQAQPELICFIHKPSPFFYDNHYTTWSITVWAGENAVACFPVLLHLFCLQSWVCSIAASTIYWVTSREFSIAESTDPKLVL